MNKYKLSILIMLLSSVQLYSQSIRILPLGDSITKDSFRDNSRPDSVLTGYRQPLWIMLKSAGYSVDFIGNDSSGYGAVPKFDPDNAGFGGYTAKQILNLLETGYGAKDQVITPGPYLNYYPADIILLHIGTNELDTSVSDVEKILNYIDYFQDSTNTTIWVVLAEIINEAPYSLTTTIFNNNLEKMAKKRIEEGDKIKIVDMEKDAGMNYKIDTTAPYSKGDMYDKLHPNKSGYRKMAALFYDSLSALINQITPVEFAGLAYYKNKKDRMLFWQTSIELNNYGFEVQRSYGENEWKNIGFIRGKENSHHLQTYYFIDSAAALNNSYKNLFYRLKQVETNGNSRFLAKIAAENKTANQFKSYVSLISIALLTSYVKSDESCVHCKGIRLKLQRGYSRIMYYMKNKSKLIRSKKTFLSFLAYCIVKMIKVDRKVLLYFV
ncbi:MAG: SGNH/GDSL hydrolase family protein [Ignavibacteriaceae bacterium]